MKLCINATDSNQFKGHLTQTAYLTAQTGFHINYTHFASNHLFLITKTEKLLTLVNQCSNTNEK